MTPDFDAQLAEGNRHKNLYKAIEAMNAMVIPCERKPRILGIIPRRQHHFVDVTHVLNTFTFTTMDRCRDCGLIEISLADY